MQLRCEGRVWELQVPFACWRKFAVRRGVDYASWEEGEYVEVENREIPPEELMSDFRYDFY